MSEKMRSFTRRYGNHNTGLFSRCRAGHFLNFFLPFLLYGEILGGKILQAGGFSLLRLPLEKLYGLLLLIRRHLGVGTVEVDSRKLGQLLFILLRFTRWVLRHLDLQSG